MFKSFLTEFPTFNDILYHTKWEWSVVLQILNKAPERQITPDDFLIFDDPATPFLHEWLRQKISQSFGEYEEEANQLQEQLRDILLSRFDDKGKLV